MVVLCLLVGLLHPLHAGFKDENGVLPRDAIRKQFNGSLFYEYAAKMGKSMKEKKVRLLLCSAHSSAHALSTCLSTCLCAIGTSAHTASAPHEL